MPIARLWACEKSFFLRALPPQERGRLGRGAAGMMTKDAHRGGVARLRARGMTVRAIAKQRGISSSAVFKLIKGDSHL